MKKRDLWTGVGFTAMGLVVLALALLLPQTSLTSLLWGFTGAFLAPGIAQLFKYRKWSRPENAAAYQERLEEAQIDLRDERKAMLRSRSAHYAYLLSMVAGCGGIVLFSLLGIAGDAREHYRLTVLVLSAYVLFQYVSGLLLYRLLERRY